MNNKEKLMKLLKSVPEIKKDLEELRFGCEVFIQNYITSVIIIGDNRGLTLVEGAEYEGFLGQCGTFTQSFSEKHIKKIIGNPLEERHLRMYLASQLSYFSIDTRNNLDFSYFLIALEKKVEGIMVAIDNSKSFDNQTEEVYGQIYNYLITK